MSNLTRPLRSSTGPVLHARVAPGSSAPGAALLEDLRTARHGEPALPGLEPAVYARTHAAFEQLSDQRGVIAADLRERMAARGEGPIAVLSVGCGDGTLDAPLARALVGVAAGRPVRYVGVDPYAASTEAFAAALRELAEPSLSVEVHTSPFEDLELDETFDVITFVHSMYYVPDVAEAVTAAYALLRPGGELLVLSAPRAELNALVEVLAPPLEGHDQWFSDDVAAGLARAGQPDGGPVTLEAGFDAAAASDEVLDFAVQARLTADLGPLVRAYLDAVSVPTARSGDELRVPHPVDVYRVVRPG